MPTADHTMVEIQPLSQEFADHTGPVCAAMFTLGQRPPVVRLVAEPFVQAERAKLDIIGGNLEGVVTVGVGQWSAAGFPAWPILADPEHAHYALNIVGELCWAQVAAATKPQQVRQRFAAIAVELCAHVPHFVPTLMEELARIYLEVSRREEAKRCITQARAFEQEFGLGIDWEQHQMVAKEFAALGLLSAKVLAAESQYALQYSAHPKQAFDYFLGLCSAQARAGVPPYAAMARDLRRVGQSAGMRITDIDVRVLGELARTKALVAAPKSFVRSMRSSAAWLMQSQPEFRDVFARVVAAQ